MSEEDLPEFTVKVPLLVNVCIVYMPEVVSVPPLANGVLLLGKAPKPLTL
jgi:hypothetical protein